MASVRAPKQWSLTKQENITSFEAWRQNLQYTLSLDKNFAEFLTDGSNWERKTNANPTRGFTDDPAEDAHPRTAAQKATHLELMLGQIANYCPVISRNTIVKNSTSVKQIWQAIRLHYGFQTSGGHFLDLNNIHLEPGERPEDLFQRLTSFVEDNLLRRDGSISHHGVLPDADEELSPTLENMIVLNWLRLINPGLPSLVKQRYGTELRSKTLASLKPEISQALDSLLEEISSNADARVFRAQFKKPIAYNKTESSKMPTTQFSPTCPLCKQAGRPEYRHYLSKCKFLPDADRKYFKARQTIVEDENDQEEEEDYSNVRSTSTSRRVATKHSPFMKVFYEHHPLMVTLDTGAEVSMIKHSVAKQINAPVKKSSQSALQADGITPLKIVGETRLQLSRDNIKLSLEALVVDDLDVDILAGIPFMNINDIAVRPAKQQIIINDSGCCYYGQEHQDSSDSKVRRTQAFVLRSTSTSTVVWPGEYIEMDIPSTMDPECTLSLEPRPDCCNPIGNWPSPQLVEAVGGKVRIFNDSVEPKRIKKHDHFCQVRYTTEDIHAKAMNENISKPAFATVDSSNFSTAVKLDPDNILPDKARSQFKSLLNKYDSVFDPTFNGYNGTAGSFKANVNMGPVQPPQRKGRVPQYSRDKLVELQEKFDELESQGVFKRPEEVDINVEYLNPSFLVKKPKGGHRLVTAFSDVGRYSKPQPSLMPDVDSTLRTIAQWKYVITTDLTSAFYQIPLAKSSMKYCGVATPFKGIRVYTRSAMGMPGSETALEELMCRVLGDFLQEGSVAKLADDLYCGGNTIAELLRNWENVLNALNKCDLRLSPAKTVICPKTTTILGWKWSDGTLSASPHRIAVLSTCPMPETVHGLRSFIGAYKFLGRVLPNCSAILSPLDDAVAGLESKQKVMWTEHLQNHFIKAQQSLSTNKTILLPRPDDQLWIITDGSVTKRGLGATLYINRHNKLSLAGFFSAKLRKHQVTWLPCEIEALCIAAAVKHFSPYIIQSKHQACVLTDSKPCVQSIEKLCRGEFSSSPRVTSFLSTVSRYQVSVRHLPGSANVPSDFASRNAPDCNEPRCQICSFIIETEDTVVRSIQVNDIMENLTRLPFTTRSAWLNIQTECPDLRRAHAHLKQGTRPSKKITNIKDVKRLINVATIAKDNLLVVKQIDPFKHSNELIVVPRTVLDGLLTALHIKLNHPSKHQLQQVVKRHFYALDMDSSITRISDCCHTCASLNKFPATMTQQSSEDPPETIGLSFAADIMKRNRQLVLVLRETVTSFTKAMIIDNEKQDTLRDALVRLSVELHPLDGPPAVIRVDPAPGFVALVNDDTLKRLHITLEIGRVKNPNKNPVAEKAISELEDEILRFESGGGPITPLGLAITIARLNSRIRMHGLSSRELWTQRSQFTHEQLPINDQQIIIDQQKNRTKNHPHSEKSKTTKQRNNDIISVGDLVYLYSDRNKLQGRNRYLVTKVDGEWCLIKKFTGNQLRASSYKVRIDECYRVKGDIGQSIIKKQSNDESDDEDLPITNIPLPKPVDIPVTLSSPSMDLNQINECPIMLGTQELNDISSDTEIDNIDTNDSINNTQSPFPTNNETTEYSRPQRTRKRPDYLKDYIE